MADLVFVYAEPMPAGVSVHGPCFAIVGCSLRAPCQMPLRARQCEAGQPLAPRASPPNHDHCRRAVGLRARISSAQPLTQSAWAGTDMRFPSRRIASVMLFFSRGSFADPAAAAFSATPRPKASRPPHSERLNRVLDHSQRRTAGRPALLVGAQGYSVVTSVIRQLFHAHLEPEPRPLQPGGAGCRPLFGLRAGLATLPCFSIAAAAPRCEARRAVWPDALRCFRMTDGEGSGRRQTTSSRASAVSSQGRTDDEPKALRSADGLTPCSQRSQSTSSSPHSADTSCPDALQNIRR